MNPSGSKSDYESISPKLVDCDILENGEKIKLIRKDGEAIDFPRKALFYLLRFREGKSVSKIIFESYSAGHQVDFILLKETLGTLYWSHSLRNEKSFDVAFKSSEWLPVKNGRLLNPFFEWELKDRSKIYLFSVLGGFGFLSYLILRSILTKKNPILVFLFPQTFLTLKTMACALSSEIFTNENLNLSVQLSPLGLHMSESTLHRKKILGLELLLRTAITIGLAIGLYQVTRLSCEGDLLRLSEIILLLVASLLFSPSHKTDVSSYLINKKDKNSSLIIAMTSFSITCSFLCLSAGGFLLYSDFHRTLLLPLGTIIFLMVGLVPDVMEDLDFFLEQLSSYFSNYFLMLSKALQLFRRRDAYDLLAGLPLFQSLQPSILKKMAENSSVKRFSSGTRVLQEGQNGTELFYILKGVLGVTKKEQNGRRIEILTLTKGALFGEGGFFWARPRSAEVVAKGSVVLLVIKRPKEFEENSSNVIPAEGVSDFQKKIWAFQILSKSPLFESLPTQFFFQLLSKGLTREIEAGVTIIGQGDHPDSMWFVIEGKVEVRSKDRQVKRLGPGTVVGEIGVIWNVSRTGTVITLTKVIALQVSATEVRQILVRNLNLGVLLQRIGSMRLGEVA